MSTENMALYLQAAADDHVLTQNLMDVTERLEGNALSEALAEQATAAGYAVTAGEAEQLRAELSRKLAAEEQQAELSDHELEAVAGGGLSKSDLAGAAKAAAIGYLGGPAGFFAADQLVNDGKATKAVKDFFSKW